MDELFRRFCSNPVFVIIDVRPGVEGIPVTAYRSKEEVEQVGREGGRGATHRPAHRQTTDRQTQGLRRGMAGRGGPHRALHWLWRELIGLCGGGVLVLLQEGKEISRTFEHIPSSVGALEAEEVPPHI